ncbi:hypothetical protein KW800_01715 [Candidatus Parcubacteria bacterium]|nr:hypothetical protein [Candidatus Parcubacteria bacterium]
MRIRSFLGSAALVLLAAAAEGQALPAGVILGAAQRKAQKMAEAAPVHRDTVAVKGGLMLVCDVQQAVIAVTGYQYADGSKILASASAGITFLLVVDSAGKRLTLLSPKPIPVWKNSVYAVTYHPRSAVDPLELIEISSLVFDLKSQGTIFVNGILMGATSIDAKADAIIQKGRSCR